MIAFVCDSLVLYDQVPMMLPIKLPFAASSHVRRGRESARHSAPRSTVGSGHAPPRCLPHLSHVSLHALAGPGSTSLPKNSPFGDGWYRRVSDMVPNTTGMKMRCRSRLPCRTFHPSSGRGRRWGLAPRCMPADSMYMSALDVCLICLPDIGGGSRLDACLGLLPRRAAVVRRPD